MKAILDSIQPVVRNSKLVRIDENAILEFSKQVETKDLEDSEFDWKTILPKDAPEEKQIARRQTLSPNKNNLVLKLWQITGN